MKKWLKILIIVLIVIIIGFIIWKIATYQEKTFKPITIENNHIFNTIDNKNYLDTIVFSGIKSLDIDSLIIIIKPLSQKDKNDFLWENNSELKAHIKGEGNTYIIYIQTSLGRNEYIEIMSHELIHLNQYYTEKLQIIEGKVYWENKEIDLDKYSYEKRPWEKEAYENQKELAKKMKLLLY